MAKAERFEDLIAWQEARGLRKEIYAAGRNGHFAKDLEMRGQIRGAALSAMSNIAGGFERASNRESAQFLNIAKGAVGEVRSVLCAAPDEGHPDQTAFDRLCDRALSVSRRCSRFITYLLNARRNAITATSAPKNRGIDAQPT
jgi:four helix bundle protein